MDVKLLEVDSACDAIYELCKYVCRIDLIVGKFSVEESDVALFRDLTEGGCRDSDIEMRGIVRVGPETFQRWRGVSELFVQPSPVSICGLHGVSSHHLVMKAGVEITVCIETSRKIQHRGLNYDEISAALNCERAALVRRLESPAVRWSKPRDIRTWAAVFGEVHANTIAKQFAKQVYRNRKVGALYQVAIDDVPVDG